MPETHIAFWHSALQNLATRQRAQRINLSGFRSTGVADIFAVLLVVFLSQKDPQRFHVMQSLCCKGDDSPRDLLGVFLVFVVLAADLAHRNKEVGRSTSHGGHKSKEELSFDKKNY